MRRLHPLSAVLRVGRAALQGAFFGFFAGTAATGALGLPFPAVTVLVPLGALLAAAVSALRYLRFTYEIDGETLRVESGVFARQSREIPLGRIQNVDTTQGVVNRLLGLTVVEFETAGGSATEATLDAVDGAEADRLRRLVRAHDRDRSDGPASRDAADETESADDALTETQASTDPAAEVLFAFSWRDLLTYAVVSIRPAAPVLTVIGLPLGSDLVVALLEFNLRVLAMNGQLGLPLLGDTATPRLTALALLTLAEFVVAAVLVSVVLTVVEYHGFALTREADDLRYERGLIRRYSGTIPLEKVQTVSVRENVLMRRLGYATLVVETAGYGPQRSQSSRGVAVPMAPRDAVYDLARDIQPFGDLHFDRPPGRARRRYVVRFGLVVAVVVGIAYALDTRLLETGWWWAALGLFLLVPPAAHLRWRHRGYDLTDDAIATRTGFWRRTTRIVPYYRIQTVFVRRSLFQRRRRLATLTADTASSSSLVGGDASAFDIGSDVAAELRDTLRDRLRTDLLARKSGRHSSQHADGALGPRHDARQDSTGDDAGQSVDEERL